MLTKKEKSYCANQCYKIIRNSCSREEALTNLQLFRYKHVRLSWYESKKLVDGYISEYGTYTLDRNKFKSKASKSSKV